MFWSKKKAKEPIKDPVTKYGEIIRNNKGIDRRIEKKRGLIDRLFKGGCDRDFVYYDE